MVGKPIVSGKVTIDPDGPITHRTESDGSIAFAALSYITNQHFVIKGMLRGMILSIGVHYPP